MPAPSGVELFWFEETGGYGSDLIRGFRVDSSGAYVWPGDIIEVASTPSVKGRRPLLRDAWRHGPIPSIPPRC